MSKQVSCIQFFLEKQDTVHIEGTEKVPQKEKEDNLLRK